MRAHPLGPAVVVVILVLAVAFVVVCLADLARAKVRYMPKWAWALMICISVPWGGLVYLAAGKVRGAPGSLPDTYPDKPVMVTGGSYVPRRGTASPVVIEVDQLTKRFGAVTAVDGLSFAVRPGHVTGFLGPNGAGKTTTMRVILGLDAPTSGTALVGGRRYQEIVRPLHEAGSLLDATAVHGGRTAWSHLLSLARSNGIRRERVTQALELTGLEAVAGRRIREFSLGMKQRLGIAAALLADPPALIFDEPALPRVVHAGAHRLASRGTAGRHRRGHPSRRMTPRPTTPDRQEPMETTPAESALAVIEMAQLGRMDSSVVADVAAWVNGARQ